MKFLQHYKVLLLATAGLVSGARSQEKPVPVPAGARPSAPSALRVKSTATIKSGPAKDPSSYPQFKGTIGHFATVPQELSLVMPHRKEPILFSHTKATIYRDLAGSILDPATLKPGTPVIVSFSVRPNPLVAEVVIAQGVYARAK